MDDETRKESSVPVQSRISIVDLAKMDWYWMKAEGVHIRTMSQLVSWTFTALCDILESNDKMPENAAEDVLSAHKYLMTRGLYQSSLKKRSESRIVAALGFENLRKQGNDPAIHGNTIHKVIHSKHSINVVDRQIDHGGGAITNEEWDEMQKRIAEEGEKEEQKDLDDAIESAKNSGMIREESHESVKSEFADRSEEEFHQHLAERDKEIIEKENAPIDPDDFNIVKE